MNEVPLTSRDAAGARHRKDLLVDGFVQRYRRRATVQQKAAPMAT
jgi:hypothetical protein